MDPRGYEQGDYSYDNKFYRCNSTGCLFCELVIINDGANPERRQHL